MIEEWRNPILMTWIICFVAWTISSCVSETGKAEYAAISACAQSGGTWISGSPGVKCVGSRGTKEN